MNRKNSLLLPPQFFETDSDKKIRTILDLGVDALYLFDHFKNPTDSTKPTYIFTEEIFSLYKKELKYFKKKLTRWLCFVMCRKWKKNQYYFKI